MDKLPLKTNVITQVAFVVRDIETSAKAFSDFLGLPMPEIKMTAEYEFTKAQYRGNPTKARAKLAFLPIAPGVRLELIQPDGEPSTWKDALDAGEGFHHLAFNIKGMKEIEATLARNGMPVLQKAEYTGGRYSYIDATKQLKMVVELLEND